jgi:hypothetical protein
MKARCDIRIAAPAASTSGLIPLRQPIGNPAVQALEFGPAHLHRDVVRAEDWIRYEIQLYRISV